MKKDLICFWILLGIVFFPIFVGLMTDKIIPALFGVFWGLMWWVIFHHTELGRKAYKKCGKIANKIMGDCDV